MRLPVFLLALCLAAMVAFGAALSSRQPTNTPSTNVASQQTETAVQLNDDTSRMWRRAEILVVPLEQVERNRAALESLRDRVAQAERETSSFWLVDPSVRQQLLSQVQLMRQLLAFAEQQQGEGSDCTCGGTAAEPTRGSDDVRSMPQRYCGSKSR